MQKVWSLSFQMHILACSYLFWLWMYRMFYIYALWMLKYPTWSHYVCGSAERAHISTWKCNFCVKHCNVEDSIIKLGMLFSKSISNLEWFGGIWILPSNCETNHWNVVSSRAFQTSKINRAIFKTVLLSYNITKSEIFVNFLKSL